MYKCLKDVEGLTVKDDSIDAVPKAGKNALGAMAEAIGLLVVAGYPKMAWRLVRMCEPQLRLELLAQCEHATRLKTSNDPKVREAMNFAMNIAARDAWTRQDLSQLFELLPLCSPDTRNALKELTGQMLHGLDDHAFIEAVRLELEASQAPDTAAYFMQTLIEVSKRWDPTVFASHARPLREILQSLAGKLDALQDVDGFAKLIRKLLDSASTAGQSSDTLLLAVTLVAKLPGIEQAVTALQRLNLLLSLRIEPGLVAELQVRIRAALFERAVNDAAIHKIMVDILHTSQAAQGVRQALRAGDSDRAKRLAVSRPKDMAFHEAASAMVIKFRPGKSAGAGIQVPEQEKIDAGEKAARQQISMVLDRLGVRGHELRSRMCKAMPTLCGGANGYELDFILASPEGQALVAQAVIDHLSMSPSAAEVVSVFTELAHRIDLQAALLASPQGTLDFLQTNMANVTLDENQRAECTRRLDQWYRGWKLPWMMHLRSWQLQDSDRRSRLAVLAIDAAASDAEPGDSVRRADSLSLANPALRDYAQDALSAMLSIEVSGGQPLLSDDGLRNVMRIVASDEDLAKSTFVWISDLAEPKQVKLYKAMAHVLTSPLREYAPSNAAAYAAFLLVEQAAEVVHPGMGKKEWQQLCIWAASARK